ncbi:MAG: HyaD/HybD family hydrogenase maturation endopeptidase [Acetobacter fabarum]|uniref:HyaD/HybD family hydrogenase maturation endopeptidase n=1 Tax=Acetobacter fabarum TaxID=483199 RepID=UPI00242A4488|nr:HyaD/HybD family hydrogenase maturation endopeptidase [Acetobacter fabarum]MCH4026387.1 HyaD/HybD family hydrogenase maturation endopeptidase [Acetobacter fabarum]MCH4055756.1 HyaD/HybD family hydrogenase maturation endopeptidase [Acetobacter fabarum]MCH4085751.1 HyaD/HybD family hydrogenase maturation endopeptidase [Acetobacter fabarum]MCH4128283.1 HyaD/HybD family hydrogenase maturation endopeptidase [Acetobacter fabarum]MCH4137006.1 HyaD/HybD family hydrogenase maturation endopeptidase [
MAADAVLYGNERKILVLGIGNILWADEGFGVRAVEHLAAHYSFGPDVQIMDGGTQGLYLLPVLEDLETLIIVDAIDFGLSPATLHHVEGSAVPATIGARKMSLHQTGFQEVLALLELRGHAPRAIHLVGVQPVTMQDYGGGLTEAVARQVPHAVHMVLELLAQRYGVCPRALQHAPAPGAGVMTQAVARTAYEQGRPSEELACRYGDERVLARRGV